MKKVWILLAVFAVLIILIQPVSSVNLNGTIGTGAWNTTNFNLAGSTFGMAGETWHLLFFNDIEKTTDLKSLIYWYSDQAPSFDAGAPSGKQTYCTFKLSSATDPPNSTGPIIGTGSIGYARLFNLLGQELTYGNIYVQVNTWNVSWLPAGDYYVYVDYQDTALYNMSTQANFYWVPGAGNFASGNAGWVAYSNPAFWALGGSGSGAPYTINKGASAYGWYNVDKPLGMGIEGYVNKTNGNGGSILYPSRAFVTDQNYSILSSEGVMSTNPLFFSVTAEQIYVSLLSNTGTWYNSSLLFATPTPTPTPGISNSTITELHVWDEGGNYINGANIHIRDIENNTWLNSTGDPDGRLWIETQRDHHLDLYADYDIFENAFLPAQLLNVETGGVNANYTYFLTLFDFNSLAPPGFTSLYVEVKDAQTHHHLDDSTVRATLPNGTYYTKSTSNIGYALFLVPNNTMINCAASQTGYLPGSSLVNSTGASSFTTTIELNRQLTATPTPYIPPTLTPLPVITTAPGGTGTYGNYSGFWAPFYNGLIGMGADVGELGVIMTSCFAVFGLIGGGIATGYNPRGASAGASLGFILSCAFNFINVWLVIVGVAWLLASFFLYRGD